MSVFNAQLMAASKSTIKDTKSKVTIHDSKAGHGKSNAEEVGSKKSGHNAEMGSKKSAHNAENARKNIVYEPFEVTIATAQTAVSLLGTQEVEVLERVLSSINTFIAKEPEHLLLIRDLNIVDTLMLSMDHRNECIRRYALKILAELCEFPDIVNKIRDSPTAIETLCSMLINDENDKVIFEFSSEILSAVGGNFGTVRMLRTNIAEVMIPRICNPDPDVQKNCLEVMIHILRDPIGGDALTRASTFELCPLIKLFTSEYEAVQRLALRVFEYLTQRTKDPLLVEQFIKERAVDALMGVLEQIEWKDLHHLALCCIKNYVDSEKTLEQFFHSNALSRLVRYTEVIQQPDIIECALEVLVRIAKLPGGCEICIMAEVPKLLVFYIKEDYQKAAETACVGLVNMMTDHRVFDLVVETCIAKELLEMMKDPERKWEVRHFAATTLYTMMKRDKRVVDQVFEYGGVPEFCALFKPDQHTPLETLFTGVHCLEQMSHYEDVRIRMLDANLIDSLLSLLHSKAKNYFHLIITTLQCLSTFLNENIARDWFLAGKGVDVTLEFLNETFIPLKLEAVAIVRQAANDETLASAFIHGGALDMLISERPLRKKYPIWEATIEALFQSNLSAKFAYIGRLDMEDITKDNFYITERVEKKFPILENILHQRVAPIRPIYVANFKQPPSPPPRDPRRRRPKRPPRKPSRVSEVPKKPKKNGKPGGSRTGSKSKLRGSPSVSRTNSSKASLSKDSSSAKLKKARGGSGSLRSIESVDGRKNRRSKRMLKRLATKLARTGQTSLLDLDVNRGPTSEQFNAVVAAKYGVCPPDYNLFYYLNELKGRVVEPVHKYWYEAKKIDVPDLIARAQILAVFVDECMKGADASKGRDDKLDCLRHKHELHIKELQRQSGTNVIPIGHVRVGMHLERAMLYKVLADRIGLPCALQRGEYGRTWAEVVVPEVCCDQDDWELPTTLMRPNFVMDLTNNVGTFMPIGGHEAVTYCNLPGVYDYPLDYRRAV